MKAKTKTTPLVDAAIARRDEGWAIFPCKPRGKDPLTKHGFKDASRELAQIRAWWKEWPDANIGGATGKISGRWALDIDPRHDGSESLEALEAEHGELEASIESLTGGGGRHLFFLWDETNPVGCGVNVRPGVDYRGDGGYVILPGSVHPSGRAYEHEAMHDPSEHELTPAPPWLLGLVNGVGRTRKPPLPTAQIEGGRNELLASLAGAARRRGASETEILALIMAANGERCRPKLSDDEVGAIARSIARYTPETSAEEEAQAAELSAALDELGGENYKITGISTDSQESGPDSVKPQPLPPARSDLAALGALALDEIVAGGEAAVTAALDDHKTLGRLYSLKKVDPGAWEARLAKIRPKRLGVALARAAKARGKAIEEGARPRPARRTSRGDRRPEINTSSGGLDDHIKQGVAALAAHTRGLASTGGGVYRRGEALVHVYDGALRLLTPGAMSAMLAEAAVWTAIRGTAGKQRTVHVYPPRPVVEAILATPPSVLPEIRGIYRHPVLARDARGELTVHDQPGYHPDSRLVVSPYKMTTGSGDPNAARDWLAREILSDFPFADESEEATAWSLLFGPLLRPAINGPVPLHLVEAPVPGAGKGLLVQAALGATCGVEHVAVHPAPGVGDNGEAEWKKTLTAILLTGEEGVVIDNIRGKVESGALEAALTAKLWRDRILSRSAIAEIPVSCVWAATGNNAIFSPDLARRSLRARLVPTVDDPSSLTGFRHGRLLDWIGEHQDIALGAAWACVSAWVAAGAPRGKLVMGSYESWASITSGLLAWLGIPGLGGNRTALLADTAPQVAEDRALVAEWVAEWEDQWVTARELIEVAERAGLDLELRGKSSDVSKARRLTWLLGRLKDRVIDGFTVQRRDMGRRAAVQWSVQIPEKADVERASCAETAR